MYIETCLCSCHIVEAWYQQKISFSGIPNSRNVLFLQIFLKCAAKLSAGNPVEPVEPDLALHQRFPKPSPGPSLQLSPEPVEPGLALTKVSWNHLWNLLPEPVEPDLALHQSLPDLSPEPSEPSPEPRWTWPGRLHQCTPELGWRPHELTLGNNRNSMGQQQCVWK